jgi:polyisoprenoid-binding protein YceI
MEKNTNLERRSYQENIHTTNEQHNQSTFLEAIMKSFIATLLVLASVMTLNAQTMWKADKAHSNVNFTVTHLMISEVSGNFKEYDVTVTTNGEDFKNAVVEAAIKTASVNTENENRDKHLRSDDFFNSDSFPMMTFKSNKIEQTGTDTYKIYGTLTIRDVSKPVVLDAKYMGKQEAWGTTKIGFKATTSINRFDYSVKWDKQMDAGGFIVANSVNIVLLMELNQQKKDDGTKK